MYNNNFKILSVRETFDPYKSRQIHTLENTNFDFEGQKYTFPEIKFEYKGKQGIMDRSCDTNDV